MHAFFHIGEITIPAYGFMIALGVLVANIAAVLVLKKTKLDFNDFLIVEAYCILGGFVGAKILYLMVTVKEIEWGRITDLNYLNQLMLSGFVFYGGLIGGLLFAGLAGRIHRIKSGEYIRSFIFLIPFIHGFGRIGCFLAGCCYGIPYEGPFAVVFPEGSFALAGVKLFPVQLVEAIGLIAIALLVMILQLKAGFRDTIEVYFVLYGILRFGMEKLRYDEARGFLWGLSTSQWISIAIVLTAAALYFRNHFRSLGSFNN